MRIYDEKLMREVFFQGVDFNNRIYLRSLKLLRWKMGRRTSKIHLILRIF